MKMTKYMYTKRLFILIHVIGHLSSHLNSWLSSKLDNLIYVINNCENQDEVDDILLWRFLHKK